MMPQPGLHNLAAYCRSAAAGLDERVAARKGRQPETTANLQAMAATWRDWAEDLEKLIARSGSGTSKGWGE